MTDTRRTPRKILLGIGLVVALLVGVAPLTLADEAAIASTGAEATVDAPVYTPLTTFNGMRVYVDQNGRLRPPTEAERAERQRVILTAIDESAIRERQRVPHKSADGTMSYVLDTSYLHASVAHVAADGTLSWTCTADATDHLHPAMEVK